MQATLIRLSIHPWQTRKCLLCVLCVYGKCMHRASTRHVRLVHWQRIDYSGWLHNLTPSHLASTVRDDVFEASVCQLLGRIGALLVY